MISLKNFLLMMPQEKITDKVIISLLKKLQEN